MPRAQGNIYRISLIVRPMKIAILHGFDFKRYSDTTRSYFNSKKAILSHLDVIFIRLTIAEIRYLQRSKVNDNAYADNVMSSRQLLLYV